MYVCICVCVNRYQNWFTFNQVTFYSSQHFKPQTGWGSFFCSKWCPASSPVARTAKSLAGKCSQTNQKPTETPKRPPERLQSPQPGLESLAEKRQTTTRAFPIPVGRQASPVGCQKRNANCTVSTRVPSENNNHRKHRPQAVETEQISATLGKNMTTDIIQRQWDRRV